MKNKLSAYPNFFMSSDGTIADALTCITENKHGAVIVVDDRNIVYGIVADGDVRRAMLKGATMLTPIMKLVNTNSVVLPDTINKEAEAEKIFGDHVGFNLVPVVAADNTLVDIMIRNTSKA
ncbi:CBS domain-containing protein [Candidatus Kaiserbacteria bacterium]|nr:CBS domain-containing protein [Candidatus Kaiserbacteria bacterium]